MIPDDLRIRAETYRTHVEQHLREANLLRQAENGHPRTTLFSRFQSFLLSRAKAGPVIVRAKIGDMAD